MGFAALTDALEQAVRGWPNTPIESHCATCEGRA